MDNPAQGHNGLLMRYLDGEMTEKEKLEFENVLGNDKELRQELQDLKIAKDAVRLYGLKKKVAEIHQLMMEEIKPVKPPVQRFRQLTKVFRYVIAIAASIILLFLLVEAYNFYMLNSEGLFGEKYSEYKLSASVKNTTANPGIEKAYKSAKYQQIIAYHNKKSFNTSNDLFFLGIAYLKTENLSKAIQSFNSIIDKNKLTKTDTLLDETEYYLALTYLKNKDYDQAIVLMKKIHEDPQHLYNKKFTSTYIRRVKMLKWRE